MTISASLTWDSNIAAGATADAAAVRALSEAIKASGAAQSALGAAAANAAAGVQALKGAQAQQAAAAASAAAQNAAMARIIQLQAKGEQDRARIVAQGGQQRVAAEQAAAAQQAAIASQSAAKLEAIEAKHVAKMGELAAKEAADARKAAGAKGAAGGGNVLGAFNSLSGASGVADAAEKMIDMAAQSAGPVGQAVAVAAKIAVKTANMIHEALDQAAHVVMGLGQAGIGLVFAATSARESLVGSFEAMGRSHDQSEALYKKIVAISIATGRDKSAIAGEFKRLAAAGFKDDQLPAIATMLADVSQVQGESKAKQLEKIFEKINAHGSLDKRAMTALASQGHSEKAINEALAKALNKPVADIPALIKSGKVSAATAEAAIAKVVEGKVSGAAMKEANSTLGLIARIKIAFEEMFALDGAKMTPVKNFLQGILANIAGPEGEKLRGAVENLFGSIFETAFGDLNKSDAVKDAFKQITAGVNEAAAAVRSLRPEVQALLALFKQSMHDGTIKDLVAFGKEGLRQKMHETAVDAKKEKLKLKAYEHPGEAAKDVGQGAWDSVKMVGRWATGQKQPWEETGAGGPANDNAGTKAGPAAAKAGKASKAALGALDAGDAGPQAAAGIPDILNTSMSDQMGETGQGIGGALNAGMAQGIADTMQQAVDAGGASAQAIIERVRAVLRTHSPSEVFEEIGGNVSQGLAGGIAGDAHHAVKAAGAMAGGTVDAAASGFGPSSAAGGKGKGGGGPVTLNFHEGAIKIGAGASKGGDDKALARMIAEEIHAEFRRTYEAA